MKLMKKILAVALTGVMALSMFTACDGSAGTDHLTDNLNKTGKYDFTYDIDNERNAKDLINATEQYVEAYKHYKEEVDKIKKSSDDEDIKKQDKYGEDILLAKKLAAIVDVLPVSEKSYTELTKAENGTVVFSVKDEDGVLLYKYEMGLWEYHGVKYDDLKEENVTTQFTSKITLTSGTFGGAIIPDGDNVYYAYVIIQK